MVRQSCFQIKQNGIHDNLLNTLEDFLRNRKQRVFVNEQTSNWENIHDEKIPLRPWLFLIYINNLAKQSFLADDTILF